ncbi:hypothetical protein, partial [Psychrobacter sp. CAL606-MNA-CIBAN-0158]|uniref:hypothetical protein n=1 Tax=Psychrobacter sp. CAL606-MNA-CIBAN-0158 TaxID=3140461 RepID=UPI00332894A1
CKLVKGGMSALFTDLSALVATLSILSSCFSYKGSDLLKFESAINVSGVKRLLAKTVLALCAVEFICIISAGIGVTKERFT